MRQIMSTRKTHQLAEKYNLPVKFILVRGGENHRKDLCLTDGRIIQLRKDGTLQEGDARWSKS